MPIPKHRLIHWLYSDGYCSDIGVSYPVIGSIDERVCTAESDIGYVCERAIGIQSQISFNGPPHQYSRQWVAIWVSIVVKDSRGMSLLMM